jgi:hypothetical protein
MRLRGWLGGEMSLLKEVQIEGGHKENFRLLFLNRLVVGADYSLSYHLTESFRNSKVRHRVKLLIGNCQTAGMRLTAAHPIGAPSIGSSKTPVTRGSRSVAANSG